MSENVQLGFACLVDKKHARKASPCQIAGESMPLSRARRIEELKWEFKGKGRALKIQSPKKKWDAGRVPSGDRPTPVVALGDASLLQFAKGIRVVFAASVQNCSPIDKLDFSLGSL
jgi:hypothetical protein